MAFKSKTVTRNLNNSTEFAIARVYTNYRVRVHTAVIRTLAYGIVTVITILLLLYYYYHIMDYFTLKLPLLLSSHQNKTSVLTNTFWEVSLTNGSWSTVQIQAAV